VGAHGELSGGAEATTEVTSATTAPSRAQALAVLKAWDDDRAAAYETGDVAALARLYVPRSATGRRDVEVLRSYRLRGLRVEGMQTQILKLSVVSATGQRIELQVTDRLAAATAVGEFGRWRLPRDRATNERVVLVRYADSWRVARVKADSAGQAPSAEASTSATVGSAKE